MNEKNIGYVPELIGVYCPTCGSKNIAYTAGNSAPVLGPVNWVSFTCRECRHVFARHQVRREVPQK